MFGLSRALSLAGVKEVDADDWHKIGAEIILAKQQKDGSWFKPGGNKDVLETCWLLLFLKQATVPVYPELPR